MQEQHFQEMQAYDRRAVNAQRSRFGNGDYGLAASVIEYPNKLAIKWQGPKRIINCLSDWIFEVQDLHTPFTIHTHHASRLRFYAEGHREVTKDLIQHALHAQGGHMVESFEGVSKKWEVQVKCLGLDALETPENRTQPC
ncbi:hypothetical protein PHPALM_31009 [Phytophthora palmivora]|uniref:Uncharacterized protein n=1 Tax=Phytophthora palmivora TaxID=4796 RepID=A0A2P4X3N4_9STRA|nr:hypothetical protein PHPALM_31009 [Phytophthora palmivora]